MKKSEEVKVNNARCEVCHRFISYSDFAGGNIKIIKSKTANNKNRIAYYHGDCLNSPAMLGCTIGEVVVVCSDVFNIGAGLIIGRTRNKFAVFARNAAVALSFETLEKNGKKTSDAKVGYEFGNRDHATILHSKRTFRNLYETDRWYRDKVNLCRTRLGLIKTGVNCKSCGQRVQHEILDLCNDCYALRVANELERNGKFFETKKS